jgi:hypothetical protein
MRPEPIQPLEDRALLAPFLSTTTRTATFTATPPTPANPNLTIGNVNITNTALTDSAAPITSISLLTPISSFGGDIVRIEAGPGGDFGRGVYGGPARTPGRSIGRG